MRIAHVVPRGEQPWSGVLTVIVNLSAALARGGHDVELWELHDWEPERYAEQRRRLDATGVAEVPLRSSRVGSEAAVLADRRGVDVVHLHGAFNPSNTAVSRALRRPFVFSPHSGYDPVSLRRGRTRKRIYAALFERAMLERASLVVTLTQVEREDARRFGASGPVEVIPNGVEPAPRDVDRDAFRRDLAIAPTDRLAVFVGRLDVHRKGLDVLVRGVAAAPGWTLALVGPPFRDVDGLERLIAELAVDERVRFVGERQGRRLLEALAAADVFALLSRWEGLPMSLLEAMSLSVPAIVSEAVERVAGVEAAGAGWVADERSLGPLLTSLRDDRGALRSRGAAAGLLSKRYDWGSVAERYADAYGRAAGSRKRVTS
jgi:glycosyltransferase involved in cell wall biosynthesis